MRALKRRARLIAGPVDEPTQELAIADKELARLEGPIGTADHRRFRISTTMSGGDVCAPVSRWQ